MNCHLSHGKDNVHKRFEELKLIFNRIGKDDISIMGHDIKFLYGDLNFRIDLDTTCQLIKDNKLDEMLINDQLLSQSHKYNLPILNEAPILFPPTYKFIPKTSEYNLSKRPPAWCDRILWFNNDPVKFIAYDYIPSLCFSDHKPIYGIYLVTVQKNQKEESSFMQEEVKVDHKEAIESCDLRDTQGKSIKCW